MVKRLHAGLHIPYESLLECRPDPRRSYTRIEALAHLFISVDVLVTPVEIGTNGWSVS